MSNACEKANSINEFDFYPSLGYPVRGPWQNGGLVLGEFDFFRDAAKGLGYFASSPYKIKERVEASFCLDFCLLFI